jgi:hypothetical protein
MLSSGFAGIGMPLLPAPNAAFGTRVGSPGTAAAILYLVASHAALRCWAPLGRARKVADIVRQRCPRRVHEAPFLVFADFPKSRDGTCLRLACSVPHFSTRHSPRHIDRYRGPLRAYHRPEVSHMRRGYPCPLARINPSAAATARLQFTITGKVQERPRAVRAGSWPGQRPHPQAARCDPSCLPVQDCA